MVELLGWEANAVETTEEVPIEEYSEPVLNVPTYIDGYFCKIRDGMMHFIYWSWLDTPDGPRRTIVDRHVMRHRTVMEGRASTNKEIAQTMRLMNA